MKPTAASEALGKKLRAARTTAGKTQRELADLLGVSPQTVLLYERGSIGLSMSRLRAIADALGVDVSRLLDSNNPPQPKSTGDRTRPYTAQELALIDAFAKIKDLPRKRLALQVVRSLAEQPSTSRHISRI